MEVVLIGDSIRMGYQPFVAEGLEGRARVWGPEENGGDSRNVLAHLDEWAMARKPDVVHVNCGLHDIKKAFDTGAAQVPFEEYVRNVEEILTRLRTAVEGRVIWALTTPVNERWHHERKGFDRFEADVTAVNEAAREICGRLDVEVNDLYAVIEAGGRDDLLVEDGVHFSEEGCRRLGWAVAFSVAPPGLGVICGPGSRG